jgi:hypothetical protein
VLKTVHIVIKEYKKKLLAKTEKIIFNAGVTVLYAEIFFTIYMNLSPDFRFWIINMKNQD